MKATAADLRRTPTGTGNLAEARSALDGGGLNRTGRIISGFVALFLLFDGAARMAKLAPYVEGTLEFGYAERLGPWIGLTLVVATVLYLIPRSSVLGAIVLTGYLGGASSSHVRLEDPWFLFPIFFGVLAWVGLYLRDARLRQLLPLRR